MRSTQATDHAPASGSLSDEALVELVRRGEPGALNLLLRRYRPLVRSQARTYFLAGGDRQDVVQEAAIGLYEAIQGFEPSRGGSFRGFAQLCVTRQVQSAVRAAARHKHGPLNTFVPLLPPDGPRSTPLPTAPDPAEMLISRRRLRDLQAHLEQVLTELEVEVLRLHLDGWSYGDIASTLGRQVKAVDNALQRVKRKLASHLEQRELAEAG